MRLGNFVQIFGTRSSPTPVSVPTSAHCPFKSCSGIQTVGSTPFPLVTNAETDSDVNKMGASLGAPAKCLLCNELTQDPVALRCNHRFCHRCIGDLWSVSPTGPYHCPEWRCTTVYQTLPFDSSLIWPTASTSRRAQTRDSRAGKAEPSVRVSVTSPDR